MTVSAGRERGKQRAVFIPSWLGSSPLTGEAHAQARRIERIDYVVTAARRKAEFYEQAFGFARESELYAADPAPTRIDGLVSVHVKSITLRLGTDRTGLIQYFDPVEGCS